MDKFAGCVVMSRFPFDQIGSRKLGASRKRRPSFLARNVWIRFCLEIEGTQVPIEIVNIHLSHQVEPRRMEELDALIQYLEMDMGGPNTWRFMIWCGDFNALTLSDYTPAELEEITAVRARNGWERPRDDVTRAITGSASKRNPMGLNFVDARTIAEEVEGPLITCRFDTRIDYMFMSPSLASCCQVSKLEHVITHPHPSDHNFVIATLDFSPELVQNVQSLVEEATKKRE